MRGVVLYWIAKVVAGFRFTTLRRRASPGSTAPALSTLILRGAGRCSDAASTRTRTPTGHDDASIRTAARRRAARAARTPNADPGGDADAIASMSRRSTRADRPCRRHDRGGAPTRSPRSPSEETAEQHDVGQRAVGKEMREGPELGAEHHRDGRARPSSLVPRMLPATSSTNAGSTSSEAT